MMMTKGSKEYTREIQSLKKELAVFQSQSWDLLIKYSGTGMTLEALPEEERTLAYSLIEKKEEYIQSIRSTYLKLIGALCKESEEKGLDLKSVRALKMQLFKVTEAIF